jgi:hypothetical protein
MVGAHSIVNLDPAPIVFNTNGLKPESFNIGNPAQGDQERLGFKAYIAAAFVF